MKIESVKIHSFKAIKSYTGEIGGKHVYLIGGNGKGKTSFIDAVFSGLSGKKLPPEPIHNGGKKGLIEIDLGDFIARTKFKSGHPAEFELENKTFEGDADKFIKSPRTYMERRIGILDFDINEFLALSDMRQVEYVAKHLAVDFTDIDAKIEELTESRKFDKKTLAEYKSKQAYYNEEDAAKEYVDIVAVSKELEANAEKQAAYDKVRDGILTRETNIADWQKQIKELEEKIDTANSEAGLGRVWMDEPENQPMSAEELQAKTETRDKAATLNEVIKEAKEAKQIDELIKQYETQINEYTENILEQKQLKAERISGVISMDELTYDVDKECFMYQDRPFDKTQTNTAAQLITGMKIASMMLKDLKILRVDASLIDKVEFDKVLSWADEQGIELFVELVDREAAQLQIKVDE